MVLFWMLTAVAGGGSEPASARLLLAQQGFEVASIRELPDQSGWFLWTGLRGAALCHGSVEVQRAHSKRPKGRFSSACAALPEGRWVGRQSCASADTGTTWQLDILGPAVTVVRNRGEETVRFTGQFERDRLQLGTREGTPLDVQQELLRLEPTATGWQGWLAASWSACADPVVFESPAPGISPRAPDSD